MSDLLTPLEVERITGKKNAAQQAAALARKRIAYTFTGSRVKLERAVALAFELMPAQQSGGVDFSKVR